MKRRISQRLVGIALDSDRAVLAEMAPVGDGKMRLVAAGDFIFPSGVGLDQPTALGQAMGRFLRQHGIHRRQAVIGLSARHLITRRCTLPPADPSTMMAGLRLQAESAFSGQVNELIVDYFGPPAGSATAEGLLVATSRTLLEQCRQVMAAAHMRLAAVTAATPSLGELTGAPNADGLLVNVTATGIDLFFSRGGVPAGLRHAGATAAGGNIAGLLAAEIRRSLMAHGASPANAPGSPVTVWIDDHQRSELATELEQSLGLNIALPELSKLLPGGKAEWQKAAPAAAVALAARARKLPVDFLHSRLAPPKVKAPRRRIARAVALVAVVVLAAAAAMYNLHQRQENLAAMQAHLAAIRSQVKEAKKAMKRLMYARRWHTGAPVLLKSFRSLTEAFPDSGSIYATSLNLRNNGRGQLAGDAGSEAQVLELRDRMHKAGEFTGISVRDVRQVGARGRHYNFIIFFQFRR